MKLAAAVGLTAAALATNPARSASPDIPLCRVTVELDPARAFVGQEVLYRLRILRRRDVRELTWEENLSFPAFRAEWLPGVSADNPVLENGESFVVYEERRAIFPVRAGQIEVPSAGLLCESEDEAQTVHVPAVTLLVDEVPAAGRPEDYSGLVGPVDVSMTVSPDRVQLGESVRVSVLVRGEANLWEVRAPFEDGFDPELAELFQRPRKLARDVGRRLALRRYFTFDIVPRRVGPLDVPEVRVAYFDPASAGYRVARARGQRVEVGERAPAAAAAPAPPGTGGEAGRAGPQRRTRPARWAWLVAGGAVLASGLVGLRRRRTRAPDVWVRVKEELALALAAEKQSEADQAAAALARALRLALSEALPDAPTLSTEEIFERTASGEPRELALLLQRLDRTRFAAAAWAEDPVDAGMALAEIRAVRLALTELREG